jgi:hypothetical protein
VNFENEDVIMPDSPIEFETQEIDGQAFEDGFDGKEQQEQPAEEQSNKIRFNFEDGEHELDYDEAVKLAQMGMNYDKIQAKVEALENDPRMAFVQELAEAQGLEVDEFIEAFRNPSTEINLEDLLIQEDLPEDVARELLENRKLLDQMSEKERQQHEEAEENKMFQDFLDYYKQDQERDFNMDNDVIPQEVWEKHAEGLPLKFAYMEHRHKQLTSELKMLQQQKENSLRAPGLGTTSFGSAEPVSEDNFMSGFDSVK